MNYRVSRKQRCHMDCFRKTFRAKHVAKARMNGCRAGAFCMAPGHTDYRKRVQYQTFDMTELLKNDENEMTVQLADG